MATAKKPKADAAKKTYSVIGPLDHDGERYAKGDTVDLTEEQAEALMPHTVTELAQAA